MRAVLDRDYASQAVRPRAFLARAFAGALASSILLALSFGGGTLAGWDMDRVGGIAFRTVTALLFLFVAALTPALVAGGILEERLGNTLEILLTTPEGPRGAAAGKFLSRMGTVLGWLAAALPPLTVTVLFGGTSWRSLVNTACALLGGTLELGAVALVVSALSRRMATAMLFAYLLPALHWWTAGLLVHGMDAGPLGQALAATGPLGALDLPSWDADLGRTPLAPVAPFLRHPGVLCLLSGLLLALLAVPAAARALRREDAGAGPAESRVPRSRLDRVLRERLTGGNPVAWKESLLLDTAWSRSLHRVVLGLLFLGEGASVALLAAGAWGRDEDGAYLGVVGFVLLSLAAVQGAASMSHERTGGAFDVLRTTPLTPAAIARGKVLGLLLGMALPLLVPAFHLLLMTLAGVHNPWAAALGAVAGILMAANAAVHGLTWGAIARTPTSALVGGVSFAVCASAGCYILCLVPLALGVMGLLRKEGASEFAEIVVVPAVLCCSPLLFQFLLVLDRSDDEVYRATFAATPAPLVAALGLLSLVLCTFFLVHAWRRLPGIFEREVARMATAVPAGPAPVRR